MITMFLILFKWQCGNSMGLHQLLFIISEEHMDIDCIFQPTMDESLKGNSITVANDDSNIPPSSVESKLTQSTKGDTTLSKDRLWWIYISPPLTTREERHRQTKITQ